MLRRMVLGLVLLVMSTCGAFAQERAIVVLDGSGSMWAQIEGEARITIARQTLRDVLGAMPPNVELGLMTYGHRDRGDCSDIEIMVPPGRGNADRIIAAADRISPRGKTPISEAVRQAAVELRYTEDKASVILITDGLETCEADPCALADELERSGVDFTAYVLGLGLTDEEGEKVACLAENTGGLYIPAGDAAALTEALSTTVAAIAVPSMAPDPMPEPLVIAQPEPEPEPEPEPVVREPLPYNLAPLAVMSEDGEPLAEGSGLRWEIYRQVANGRRGEYVDTRYEAAFTSTLEPGNYVVVAILGEAQSEQPLTITEDVASEPLFVLNAATIHVKPLRVAGDEEAASDASTMIRYPGGQTTAYGEQTVVVPAGKITLEVSIGSGTAGDSFVARAGEYLDKEMAVGVGRAVVNASYVEGMVVEAGELAVEIVRARKAIDGTRASVAYAYGPNKGHDLPPGDYVAVIELGAAKGEAPFSVAAGELTEVDVVLDAGVLAVSAPAAYSIEVLSARKDIQGNRTSLAYGYNTEFQTTLLAGSYVVKLTRQDQSVTEEEAVIVAGERTEVAID